MTYGPPIRVLIIQPDHSYEVREIEQELKVLQSLVGGGYIEAITTDYCVFWEDEEGKYKYMPCNVLATYLWWKLNPIMERRDVLQGPVFITGLGDAEADSRSVPDVVIELFERMRAIFYEHEDV